MPQRLAKALNNTPVHVTPHMAAKGEAVRLDTTRYSIQLQAQKDMAIKGQRIKVINAFAL